MTPALKAHILANQTSKANEIRANTTQVTVSPIEPESIEPAEPAQPSRSTFIGDPSDDQQLPSSSQPPEDDVSDSLSYTSTIPDVFDVGSDDSAPPATGPWTIIDHFTGEMIVDEEEVPPVPPATPGAPFDSAIQVQFIPTFGVTALVQTSLPTLLFEDTDERPDWLMISTNKFLQHVPYYMCLNKVVDLFFTQEARLGYPDKVSELSFPLFPHSLTTPFTDHHSPLVSLYHLEIDPKKLLYS
jgi:hypothetical protein